MHWDTTSLEPLGLCTQSFLVLKDQYHWEDTPHYTWSHTCYWTRSTPRDALPLPRVQATVDDQKLREPTHSVACTRVLLTRCTVHGACGKTWRTILKTKGQNMLQRPSWAKVWLCGLLRL